jgi:DDE superfamily endonuclease
MLPAPVPEVVGLLQVFAVAFTRPTFAHALIVLYGAILTPGRRTIAASLRAVGLRDERHFTSYHRVLNRAVWSPLRLSRLLLELIVTRLLPPHVPLILLVDSTLVRRTGRRIAWKGRFHDAVRSQTGHVATSEGIHWLCLAVLVPVPWSRRPWALPFLSVPTLAPATSAKLGRRHRTTPEYADVLLRLVRRWQPEREIMVVGDSAFAVVELGHTCRVRTMRLISRLVLNAQLYDPVPPRPASTPGVKPNKGPRQPKLSERLVDPVTVWKTCEVTWYGQRPATIQLATGTALWHTDGSAPLPLRWVLVRNVPGRRPPLALFCTDPTIAAEQVVAQYVDRWHIETTFEEVRAHLGLETQREWSARAVGRAVPCVWGLFSVVVLLAHVLHPKELPTRRAAWYAKSEATFVDALAAVRRHLWASRNQPALDTVAGPANSALRTVDLLIEAACYTA